MSVATVFMEGLPARQLWPAIWRATNGCLQLLALLFILLALQPAVDIIHSHTILIPDTHTKTSRVGQVDLPVYRTCCSPMATTGLKREIERALHSRVIKK